MPVWSHATRREREEELIWRGEQYRRAIMLFQRKYANTFPPNLDILVEQKFLRKGTRTRSPTTTFRLSRWGGRSRACPGLAAMRAATSRGPRSQAVRSREELRSWAPAPSRVATRFPVSVVRTPVSAISRTAALAVSKIRALAVSRARVSAVSRARVSAVSRARVSAASRTRDSALRRTPGSAVRRTPASAASRTPPVALDRSVVRRRSRGVRSTRDARRVRHRHPGTQLAMGIQGVTSKSKKTSIKLYNGMNVYNQWAFVYLASSGQAGAGGQQFGKPGQTGGFGQPGQAQPGGFGQPGGGGFGQPGGGFGQPSGGFGQPAKPGSGFGQPGGMSQPTMPPVPGGGFGQPGGGFGQPGGLGQPKPPASGSPVFGTPPR